MKFKSLYVVMILALGLILPGVVFSQPPPPPDLPVDTPIDGGISLLVAAGVGYGIKKVRDSRKKLKAEDAIQ